MIDAFERIKDEVHKTVEGATESELTYRPTDSANTIAWIVWHLTRVQDDHIAGLANRQQKSGTRNGLKNSACLLRLAIPAGDKQLKTWRRCVPAPNCCLAILMPSMP